MNQIPVDVLPGVDKLLQDTEAMISSLIGSKVILQMIVRGEKVSDKEIAKMNLQRIICEYFNVSWSQMVGPGRTSGIVNARKVYSYLANKELDISKSQIARDLKRDHTSIIHLVNTCQEHLDTSDPTITTAIHKLKNPIYENIN